MAGSGAQQILTIGKCSMWCQHNEVDLCPVVHHYEEADWICILCKGCNEYVGERKTLINLVDAAASAHSGRVIQETVDEVGIDLDPDWEDPEDT